MNAADVSVTQHSEIITGRMVIIFVGTGAAAATCISVAVAVGVTEVSKSTK